MYRHHGVSETLKQQFIREQQGLCAVCLEPLRRRPHLDHCHATGKLRGVLHAYCNLAVGLLESRSEIAEAATRYLERHA